MTTRDLLLRYFDKALLGASVVWLAQAATALAAAPSEALRADLDRSLATLGEHMRGATVRAAPPPAWSTAVGARLREAPAAPAAGPGWLLHRRPGLLFDLVPSAQPPGFVHAAPTDVVADATERGRVTVRWTPGATAYVLVSGRVERRRGDDPAWERLADVDATTREVVDEAVAPRTRYAYRVVTEARADEDDLQVRAARAAGTFSGLADDLARRESAPSAPVETPAETFVVPLSVDAVPLRPEASSAYLVVHVWDRVARRFASQRHQVKVGQPVGGTGAVLHEVGVDGATLWVTLRDPASGETWREDSRRDRLPEALR